MMPMSQIASPVRPSFVIAESCPAGWTMATGPEIPLEGTVGPDGSPSPESAAATFCEPAVDRSVPCEPHEAVFVGDAGCSRIGSECPADGFPPDVGGRVLYVRAGARGTGSRSAPFGTINEALPQATPGTTIAVAPGTYPELVLLPAGVTLHGGCAERVRIGGPGEAMDPGVITLFEGSATVRNVTVTGERPGILVDPGVNAHVEDVLIDGARFIGFANNGGHVTGARVAVRHVRPVVGGRFGRGLESGPGGTVSFDQLSVEDVTSAGVFVAGEGSSATLSRLFVRGVDPANDRASGMMAQTLANVDLRELWVEDVNDHALFAGDQVTLTLEQGWLSPAQGQGVHVVQATNTTLSRVVVRDAQMSGMHVSTDSVLRCDDCAILGVRRRGAENARGINAQRQGQVIATRVFVSDVAGLGVVGVEGGAVELQDAVVSAPRHGVVVNTPLTQLSTAVGAFEGGIVSASRLVTVGGQLAGIEVQRATASIVDALVRDAGDPAAENQIAYGLYVHHASTATAHRIRVVGATGAGILAGYDGAELTAEDVTVTGGRGLSARARAGRGIGAQADGALDLRRFAVIDNQELGIWSVGTATLTLSEGLVSHTGRTACIEAVCPDTRLGIGVGVYDAASLIATDLSVADNELVGVHVVDAVASLQRGVVSGHEIAVSAAGGQFDLGRDFTDVEFVDNDRNFDGMVLTVPTYIDSEERSINSTEQ